MSVEEKNGQNQSWFRTQWNEHSKTSTKFDGAEQIERFKAEFSRLLLQRAFATGAFLFGYLNGLSSEERRTVSGELTQKTLENLGLELDMGSEEVLWALDYACVAQHFLNEGQTFEAAVNSADFLARGFRAPLGEGLNRVLAQRWEHGSDFAALKGLQPVSP